MHPPAASQLYLSQSLSCSLCRPGTCRGREPVYRTVAIPLVIMSICLSISVWLTPTKVSRPFAMSKATICLGDWHYDLWNAAACNKVAIHPGRYRKVVWNVTSKLMVPVCVIETGRHTLLASQSCSQGSGSGGSGVLHQSWVGVGSPGLAQQQCLAVHPQPWPHPSSSSHTPSACGIPPSAVCMAAY